MTLPMLTALGCTYATSSMRLRHPNAAWAHIEIYASWYFQILQENGSQSHDCSRAEEERCLREERNSREEIQDCIFNLLASSIFNPLT